MTSTIITSKTSTAMKALPEPSHRPADRYLKRVENAVKVAKKERDDFSEDYYIYSQGPLANASKAHDAKAEYVIAKERYSFMKKQLHALKGTPKQIIQIEPTLKSVFASSINGLLTSVFPKEITTHIFACLSTPDDFKSFGSTCTYLLVFSRTIPTNELARSFARLSSPISITIENFKNKCTHLMSLFPKLSKIEVETHLREAIKSEHNNSLLILKSFFAEKAQIETELNTLKGPTGFNGAHKIAWDNLVLAQQNLDTALQERDAILSTGTTYCSATLNTPNHQHTKEKFALAEAHCLALQEKLEEAEIKYNSLRERLLVLNRAGPLNNCKIQADFYAELNIEVTESNKLARFTAMQDIIG